jgi:hypothetical protein
MIERRREGGREEEKREETDLGPKAAHLVQMMPCPASERTYAITHPPTSAPDPMCACTPTPSSPALGPALLLLPRLVPTT